MNWLNFSLRNSICSKLMKISKKEKDVFGSGEICILLITRNFINHQNLVVIMNLKQIHNQDYKLRLVSI